MRIKAITKLIKKNSIVVDIGSDHAILAISLLNKHIAKHVYNIEINTAPLQNTINNLTHAGLLQNTTNILADGLQTKEIKHSIDYCVISGMGGQNIIDILKRANKKIKISNYILVPNNNAPLLRKYLKSAKQHIAYETVIYQNKYFYNLMMINNAGLKIANAEDIYFGPYLLKHQSTAFKRMIQNRKKYIINNKLDKLNIKLRNELKIINNL
jgi:tRNA (adenine22-N1)-methyltransferase